MGSAFLGGSFVEFYLFYSFHFIGGIKAGNVVFSGKYGIKIGQER